jgi:SMODS-associated and fused to various effectors sensor domain
MRSPVRELVVHQEELFGNLVKRRTPDRALTALPTTSYETWSTPAGSPDAAWGTARPGGAREWDTHPSGLEVPSPHELRDGHGAARGSRAVVRPVRVDHRRARSGLGDDPPFHLGSRTGNRERELEVRSAVMEIPSPRGASIAGDDYQHAFTLMHVMDLLKEDRGIVGIGMEVNAAGNVDDLVVEYGVGPPAYHQVKFVMSQDELLTYTWMMARPREGARSILQRFHDSFVELTVDGVRPEMALVTNRGRDGSDPMLGSADGRDDKLMPRLAQAGPQSAAGRALAEWAEHLDIDRNELEEMLRQLRIRTDMHSLATMKDLCRLSLESCGYRGSPDAVAACLGAIRDLIIAGRGRHSAIDRSQWEQIIRGLNLATRDATAALVVQSIEPHPAAHIATASLDWIDLFETGGRQLKDPGAWMERLWPDLQEAAATARASGRQTVALMGSLRLSAGFAVGSLLPARAGIELVLDAYNERWSTMGDEVNVELDATAHDVGQGRELAAGLSTTGDLTDDVLRFIADQRLPVQMFTNLSPASGVGHKAVTDPAHARGWAQAAMRAIRDAAREYEEPLHVFQYGPLSGAILLGSVWNRMPATQLYDDVGGAGGYTPTFRIPRS